MKIHKILYAIVFVLFLCCGNSCKKNNEKPPDEPPNEEYPIITVLGERNCIGEIIWVDNPACMSSVDPCPPGGGDVLGLKTVSGNYVLSYNSQWFLEPVLIAENIVCQIGDKVEITGTVSVVQISASEKYTQLEIESIKKNEPIIVTVTGKIIMNGNPCPSYDPNEDPCVPGIVLWLETTSQNYVLNIDSNWIWNDNFIFDGVEYWEKDRVEISGTVTVWQGMEEYHELEIEAMKKLVGIRF